jgi:hypothetical protein
MKLFKALDTPNAFKSNPKVGSKAEGNYTIQDLI